MMRYVMITVFSFLLGVLLTYFFMPSQHPAPTVELIHMSHACDCINNMPKFQIEALDAASVVSLSIEQKTLKFIGNNNLDSGDFMAVFVPERNGEYSIHTWCSNRSAIVVNLRKQYKDIIYSCIEPYKKVLNRAHEKCELDNGN